MGTENKDNDRIYQFKQGVCGKVLQKNPKTSGSYV